MWLLNQINPYTFLFERLKMCYVIFNGKKKSILCYIGENAKKWNVAYYQNYINPWFSNCAMWNHPEASGETAGLRHQCSQSLRGKRKVAAAFTTATDTSVWPDIYKRYHQPVKKWHQDERELPVSTPLSFGLSYYKFTQSCFRPVFISILHKYSNPVMWRW